MKMGTQDIIAKLVDDLSPAPPMRLWQSAAAVASATLAVLLAIAIGLGLRPDLLAGDPSPMFFLRSGTLFLLGAATTLAVIQMSRPAVGQMGNGWKWALCGALLFPATAIVMGLISGQFGPLDPVDGFQCLAFSGLSSLVIGSVIVLWLRRGAPTSLSRAGWLTGLAAGSFGAFAYAVHCPANSIYYVGLWYSLAVMNGALLGRLIVPPLIRW